MMTQQRQIRTTTGTTTTRRRNYSSGWHLLGHLKMMMPILTILMFLVLPAVVHGSSLSSSYCEFPKRDATSYTKKVWTVGVLAIRGPDAAYTEFDATFHKYLTSIVSKRFYVDDSEQPIRFQMKPLNFLTLFTDTEQQNVDFIYVNPSAFSCIESEYGARSLASQISQRIISGQTYQLKKFGGVIMALKSRTDINTIQDLKNQIIAAASISGLGSGQMQFRKMQNMGMSYINDPKQLVFTSNQGKVVQGVLNGDFDVGFVRTDQLERSKDEFGNPIDTNKFKIIDSQPNLIIDGTVFPFESSTSLYPEWNLAALNHVPDEIALEVQNAMLNINEHAKIGHALLACQTEQTQEAQQGSTEIGPMCEAYHQLSSSSSQRRRCDTTDEIAILAWNATQQGKYSQWIPSLSYSELRSMQESTGFIKKTNDNNKWHCLRSAEIYDSITCPTGYLKKTQQQVETGCSDAGLDCGNGYQCICSPCYQPVNCIDSVDIAGRCVAYQVLLPAILVPAAVLFIACCFGALGIKSRQMVNQAKSAARNERELNEFIAHEVRNPLSAALSASVFVSTALQAEANEDTLDSLREDAGIINSSLRFINDLLRSMLDVHRATRDQMILKQDLVDILHDIFEPAASMIYARDANFVTTVDCPEGLVVRTDKLRLQQVVLNLARNSAKFVNEGFVRLRADVVENSIRIFVEDSGPGIPGEKKTRLFKKYQKSLDSLAQGTGVGLSLVEKLVGLMDGAIWLDETYRSGFKDMPGACMVIDLKRSPENTDEGSNHFDLEQGKPLPGAVSIDLVSELPDQLSVLFVDDDRNLRNLARRSIHQVRPDWRIREAASGESALQLCETDNFELIFMDQYMTSVEQCLKGTETVRALRSRGIKSVVCGLSANNLYDVFERAGADHFITKPFPTDRKDLCCFLAELLNKRNLLTPTVDTRRGSLFNSEAPSVQSDSETFESPVPADPPRFLTVTECASSGNLSAPESPIDESSHLPSTLKVLLVDDDRTLRRLASRALKKVVPECHVREGDSGESALTICETDTFDVIYMDHYMTSTNNGMNGTETVEVLRRNGVSSLICGLSANQLGEEFLAAGADHFILKPFPCKEADLRSALFELLSKRRA